MHRAALTVALVVAATTAWGEPLEQEPAPPHWAASVSIVKVEPGQRVHVSSTLKGGVKNHDLPMASCIPRSQQSQFRGDLTLYALALPAGQNIVVTLTPERAARHLSVFAYAVDDNRFDMPDSRAAPRSCQWATRASSTDRKHPTEIRIKGRDKPQNVVIGVSGPGEVTDAPFSLALELR